MFLALILTMISPKTLWYDHTGLFDAHKIHSVHVRLAYCAGLLFCWSTSFAYMYLEVQAGLQSSGQMFLFLPSESSQIALLTFPPSAPCFPLHASFMQLAVHILPCLWSFPVQVLQYLSPWYSQIQHSMRVRSAQTFYFLRLVLTGYDT